MKKAGRTGLFYFSSDAVASTAFSDVARERLTSP